MKTVIFLCSLCILFYSCNLFPGNDKTEKSTYNARIAWDSGLFVNYSQSHIVDGDSVFFYERPPGYNQINIYTLTRLDANTGKLIWRSFMFSDIVFCQPAIIGDYVYVFLLPNIMYAFEKETGRHVATVELDIDNKNLELIWNVTAYRQYLYTGLWTNGQYFVRFDVNKKKP